MGLLRFFFSYHNDKFTNTDRKRLHQRRLRFEALESRELLSVSQEDYSLLRESYPDLALSENIKDYNVIEIAAEDLGDAAIRDAITAAAKTTKSDLIVVRTTEESYRVDLEKTFFKYDASASYYGSMTIVSLGPEKLVIDGGQKDRILTVAKGEVALGGIVFTHGKTAFSGGAVYLVGSKFRVTQCDFLGNTGFFGGGLHCEGSLTLSESTFSENIAIEDGGGLWLKGELAIRDSVFTQNRASGSGGGICASWGRTDIIDSKIEANVSEMEGGGISISGVLSIKRSEIIGNSARTDGGGIARGSEIDLESSLTLEESRICNNQAKIGGGGGISWVSSVRTLISDRSVITECIISGNTASFGGGIITDGWVGEGVFNIIKNSTISDNKATGADGGGIYLSGRREFEITNSTIVDNSAARDGGGIYGWGGVYFTQLHGHGEYGVIPRGGNLHTLRFRNQFGQFHYRWKFQ